MDAHPPDYGFRNTGREHRSPNGCASTDGTPMFLFLAEVRETQRNAPACCSLEKRQNTNLNQLGHGCWKEHIRMTSCCFSRQRIPLVSQKVASIHNHELCQATHLVVGIVWRYAPSVLVEGEWKTIPQLPIQGRRTGRNPLRPLQWLAHTSCAMDPSQAPSRSLYVTHGSHLCENKCGSLVKSMFSGISWVQGDQKEIDECCLAGLILMHARTRFLPDLFQDSK